MRADGVGSVMGMVAWNFFAFNFSV
uniref:Uncharacterized protein n=1 Tax=Oryza punctata TaxID=4537 RepID=A0A0E0L6H5_ORYPU